MGGVGYTVVVDLAKGEGRLIIFKILAELFVWFLVRARVFLYMMKEEQKDM